MKRTLAILLALVMALTMFAACQTDKPNETQGKDTKPVETQGNDPQPTETEPEEDGPLFDEVITFEMIGREQDNNDEKTLALIKKYTNVELKWRRMDNFGEQYALLVSDNKIPDITVISGKDFADEYGPQGAYVNVYEYLDIMPNLAKILEEYPDVKKNFQLNDNEMYRIPFLSINGVNSYAGWMYRKDVFEKLGLEWPTNREELEYVMRELKKAYPESYPLAITNTVNAAMTNIVDSAHWWGTSLLFPARNNAYCNYNWETGEWYQGALSPEMKEMLMWMRSMIDEGLIYPSLSAASADIAATTYTDQVFLRYPQKLSSLATQNENTRANNPNATWVMGSPFAIGENGYNAGMSASNNGVYNFAVSASCENLEAVLKFIDWFYSEEGIRVLNYGEEGVHYTLDAEGKVVWTEEALASGNPQSFNGLNNACFNPVIDFNAYLSWQGEEFVESFDAVQPYATLKSNPSIKQYNEEQQAIADSYGASYNDYVKAELCKFLLGERDFSEWDAYVKEANETYHGEDLVKIATDAWAAQNAE